MQKREIELDAAIWFHKAQNKFLGDDRITLLEKNKWAWIVQQCS
jgi:hypothetical protein